MKTLIFLLFSSFFWASTAQTPWQRLRAELDDYTETRIIPIVKKQREKLEKLLSQADAREIASLQFRLWRINQRKKDLLSNLQVHPDSDMEVWDNVQQERNEILDAGIAYIEKYELQIQALLTALQPQQRIWRAEMNILIDQYNATLSETQLRQFKKYGFGEMLTPLGFLLWDVEDKNEAAAEAATKLYPNPATNKQHIRFQIAKQGKVEIYLLDSQGSRLQTILSQSLPKGEHSTEIDLTQFTEGVYICQIITESGMENKRIVKGR